MKPSVSIRLLSLVLAAFVCLSTVRVSISGHFCQDQLEKYSLVGNALSCSSLDEESCELDVSDGQGYEKKQCCLDAFTSFQANYSNTLPLDIDVPTCLFKSVSFDVETPSRIYEEINNAEVGEPPPKWLVHDFKSLECYLL